MNESVLETSNECINEDRRAHKNVTKHSADSDKDKIVYENVNEQLLETESKLCHKSEDVSENITA